MTLGLFRSLLFCPGNHPTRPAKAFTAGADAVILDLEDAVPLADKESARANVVAALQAERQSLGYVRVNGVQTVQCHADIWAVVGRRTNGILVPKVENATELAIVDWVITQAERAAGIEVGATDLIPIVETPAGLLRAEEIASASPRVRRIAFGAADFALEAGITWTASGLELLYPRSHLVAASRSAKREAPIDTVYLNLQDKPGYEADCVMGRNLGFQGRLVIHPDQVATANQVYRPSDHEVAWSRKVLAAWAAAEAAGSASIQVEGQFVDPPVAQRAAHIVLRAEREGR